MKFLNKILDKLFGKPKEKPLLEQGKTIRELNLIAADKIEQMSQDSLDEDKPCDCCGQPLFICNSSRRGMK